MARSKIKPRTKIGKKIALVITIIIVILGVALFVAHQLGFDLSWLTGPKREAKPVTEGTLEIHMIDVGQGDCILIRAPEGNMLIDAGENKGEVESAIKTYLEDLGVLEFEYVVFTHSDADHIGSADFVMNTYAVDNVLMPIDDERATGVYKDMMEAIDKNGADIVNAVAGDTFSIGEVEFTVLAPLGGDYTNVNDYSVVLRVDFGESSFLMTGDAEKESEQEMVDKYKAYDLDCDVLKVGHHGSHTSSNAEFLSLVTPDVALISCGEGNKHKHPRAEALDRIDDHTGDKIYRTDLLGDIVVISDGEKISVNGTVIIDESAGAKG